jgi:hypothetical protein
MSQMNVPLTGKEKEQFNKLVKPKQAGKLLNPQEKIGNKIPKDFNPRKS